MEITLVIPEMKNENSALGQEIASLGYLLKRHIEEYKSKLISTNSFIADAEDTIAECKKKIADREAAIQAALKLRDEVAEQSRAAKALLNSLENIA